MTCQFILSSYIYFLIRNIFSHGQRCSRLIKNALLKQALRLHMKKIHLLLFTSFLAMESIAQKSIPLYPGTIPNSKPVKNEEKSEIDRDSHILIISKVTQPTLTIFLPPKEKAN